MSKTIAFIPVRGNSKSIPLKNIKPLCGKPLLYWTAAAANACESIDEVVVSTDSQAIADVAQSLGLEKVRVAERSAETATDTASTESALLEYAESHDFDTMVLIQATSPLLTADDLDEGFRQFNKDGIDSVLSVVEDKRFYWNLIPNSSAPAAQPANYDVFNRPRRQDFDGCYMENGAFYISKREDIIKSRNRISGSIGLAIMPQNTAFEIDEPQDWVIIESLLAKQLEDKRPKLDFSQVKMLLTDCDGCLTDAGMYYSENGDELKKFNTRDGMAFALLREHGIVTGIITGENSKSAQRRADKLQTDYAIINCKNKLPEVKRICMETGINLAQVAYIGDDLNDIEVLQSVGFPCCPKDAQPEVLQVAQFVSAACGGKGVIRDIARKILG